MGGVSGSNPETAGSMSAVEKGEKSPVPLAAQVVLLTNFVPPYRLPLYEALADRVARLTVLVSTPVEEGRSWRPDSGRLELRVQRTLSLRRSWRHPAGFSDAAFLHVPWDTLPQLRSLRPDVVISGELGFRSLFSAVYRVLSGARLVLWATLSERSEQGRHPLRLLLRRFLLRHADRVIVNGASGARYVRSYGVPDHRIDVVPYVALPGFSEAARHSPAANDPVRHLLFVGQLTERKGLVPFLRALDAWARSHPSEEIALTIVGSGESQPLIEGFRPTGSLAIRLLGEQDPAALPAFFAQADALVFPTLADEWGLVVNEALAAGVPVLGSIHSQAVEELCHEGRTGWVFDPEDEASTRSAIDRALSTGADDLARMRELARERVRHLTPQWAADRLVETVLAALRDPS